ncbi:hypothetical protein NP493_167g04000 [Ridgeia piscesae]|uniref:Ig-like domain-containing protein n=1 Tax=Ridgeia piscesae TaxID=27915 RepID=A0AAD9P3D0_RIDPI|nr:hypothetical protein NP493_167g04000 [Ridgeia piscesae]
MKHSKKTKEPPQIIERIHRRQQVKTGETIKLPCPVEANPEPLFEWTKDGESINAGWERYRKSAKGSLRIKDAVAEDSGRYVCKATNGFGSVDVKYTVNVMQSITPIVFLGHKISTSTKVTGGRQVMEQGNT